MAQYRLLIFDFDGTLADSAAWFVAKYNELAGELGVRPIADDELQRLRGYNTREIVAFLKVPMWKLPRVASRMRAEVSLAAEQLKLFPGVADALHALKQHGFTLAVVSSNSEDNVRRILGPESTACFDAFACSAPLLGKARKLRAVMKRIGVQPAQTLCIGDEPRDVEAARQAGADSGAVLWGYANASALERSKPTLTFGSVEELSARLIRST